MKKIFLMCLVLLLLAVGAAGCGGSEEADSLREDVNQLLLEKQERLVANEKAIKEERIAELASKVAEEKIAAFKAELAEKEKENRLTAIERSVAELQKPPIVVYSITVPADATPSSRANFEARVYEGNDFNRYVGILTGPYPIDFTWNNGGPLNLSNSFSVRWKGTVWLEGGTYSFFVRANEGARLWVDGTKRLNRWGPRTGEWERVISLSSGYHDIRLDYRNVAGLGEVYLDWTKK